MGLRRGQYAALQRDARVRSGECYPLAFRRVRPFAALDNINPRSRLHVQGALLDVHSIGRLVFPPPTHWTQPNKPKFAVPRQPQVNILLGVLFLRVRPFGFRPPIWGIAAEPFNELRATQLLNSLCD